MVVMLPPFLALAVEFPKLNYERAPTRVQSFNEIPGKSRFHNEQRSQCRGKRVKLQAFFQWMLAILVL
jgi:hypothetical protein